MRDLSARRGTYVSTAPSRGVNLVWLSERTGVAESTLRRHYRRFLHAGSVHELELSKSDPESFETVQSAPPLPA
jgi:hypothetical protein